jgi:hypothetical protein
LQINPELFYSDEYNPILEDLIHRVLISESPILDSLLVQRIARAHGFQRSGRLIRERVLELVEKKYHLQLDAIDALYVWKNEQHRNDWIDYRIPETEADIRSIEEIAIEELRSAANNVHTEDKAVDVARMFGIRRLTNNARTKIELAIAKSSPPVIQDLNL